MSLAPSSLGEELVSLQAGHDPSPEKGSHEALENVVHIKQQREASRVPSPYRGGTLLQDQPTKAEYVGEALVLSGEGHLVEKLVVDEHVFDPLEQEQAVSQQILC